MTIYPDRVGDRLTGKWRVEVERNRRRYRGRYATFEEAREAEAAFKRGELPQSAAEVLSLTAAAERAVPALWNRSQHGQLALAKVRLIVSRLGQDPPLSDVTAEWLDAAVQSLRADKADATINRYLSAVHRILAWAKSRGHLTALPDFPWLDEDEGRIRYLTEAEEARLLTLAEGEVRDFIIAALDTGCRRSELLYAQRDQLDGDWLRLWKTKNGRARSVPLTDRAREALERRLPWTLTEARLRYAWADLRERMGLADDNQFVLHALRHTCATRLVSRGVNLRVVQEYMGHRAIQTTLRYAHVASDTLAAAAKSLALGSSDKSLTVSLTEG